MPAVLSRNSLEHAVAGSAATCLATLLLFPLDRVKTLIQVDPISNPGFVAAILRVLQLDGLRGLYKGCGPMLQTVSASNFLYFFLFEGLKARIAGSGSVSPYITLAASALAGSLNMAVTEPLWRACIVAQASERKLIQLEDQTKGLNTPKARDNSSMSTTSSSNDSYNNDESTVDTTAEGAEESNGSSSHSSDNNNNNTSSNGSNNNESSTVMLPTPSAVGRKLERVKARQLKFGVLGVVAKMWAEEGPAALWRGLGSSLWLVSNPVIQFFVYDLLKGLRRSMENISAAEAFLIGAVAKAIATVLTFPFQVAQSRLRAAQKTSQQGKEELDGMVACLNDVYRTNGAAGLYFGLAPKLMQTVTTAALMFMLYEKIHKSIRIATRTSLLPLLRRRRVALAA